MLDRPLDTLTAAEKRTRQLAQKMFDLNAHGTCTDILLYQEGFSRHELATFGNAARELANGLFVRRDDLEAIVKAPLRSDNELLAIALDRCGGLVGEGDIIATLRRSGFQVDTIDRLWERLVPKIAKRIAIDIAKLPHPSPDQIAAVA